MNIGTRSVIYGAHCLLIHPWFVALAWWQLYGFPWDPRLWFAFFLHDLGYWGKPNMDGDEGETHPELGASIMGWLFDRRTPEYMEWYTTQYGVPWRCEGGERRFNEKTAEGWRIVAIVNNMLLLERVVAKGAWHDFTLYHSRFYSKAANKPHSALCAADKLATALTPRWLYLLLVNLSGEVHEYMGRAGEGKYHRIESKMWALKQSGKFNQLTWHKRMTDFMRRWAHENKGSLREKGL